MVVLPAADGGAPVVVVATAEGSPGFWPSIQARGAWDHSQVGSRAALHRSADGGESWQRIGAGQGLPDEMTPMIWALCPDPRNPRGLFAGLGESSGVPGPLPRGGGAVLASGDGGESWQTLRANMSAVEHVHATAE
jgi:photosystem II stability/assembly factor-like uncharacterized protein